MPTTLVTDRLLLKPPVADDLDDMTALWTDPAVYEIILGTCPTREQVWHRLLRSIGQWHAFGYGLWNARDAATGRFVGPIGLMDSRRDTDPSFEGVPEAAWAASASFRGGGYVREAMAAVLDWADARMPRTVCIIAPDNGASIRLAGRLGYRRYADGRYGERPMLFFERVAGH